MESPELSHKLAVICRDGLTIHNFLDNHNLSKSDVVIVKTVSDLTKLSGVERYVILSPFPDGFHWSIRPKLIGLTNVTRKYNKSLINF